jgi:hypothetical protein
LEGTGSHTGTWFKRENKVPKGRLEEDHLDKRSATWLSLPGMWRNSTSQSMEESQSQMFLAMTNGPVKDEKILVKLQKC